MRDFDFSQLSASERIELAQNLLDSVRDELSELQINPLWKNEVESRSFQISSGEIKPIAWKKVKDELFPGF